MRLGRGIRIGIAAVLAAGMPLGAMGSAEAKDKRELTVMTQNLYLGSSLNPALQATTPAEFVEAVATIYGTALFTDYESRSEAIAETIQEGYPSIKIFTTDITPSRRGRMVDFGDIWEVFKTVSQERGLCVMHCEDNDIVMHMYDKLFRENRVGFEHMAEVHNAMSEDLSFRRVLGVAQNVPGIALYFMHVSAANGVEALREATKKPEAPAPPNAPGRAPRR